MPRLKKSTAVTIMMGPFLDATDQVTEETALSPAVELSKNGGAFAARSSGSAIAHDSDGWYTVPLNTTDTGTAGILIAKSHDSANHLPVYSVFEVVDGLIYDSVISGTDNQRVHTVESNQISIVPIIPNPINLDSGAIRLSILINPGDLTATVDITTPGTMAVSKKSIGESSFSSIAGMTALTMVKTDIGFITQDIVFSTGNGFAEGDMVRFNLSDVEIDVDGSTLDVFPDTGVSFYSRIARTLPTDFDLLAIDSSGRVEMGKIVESASAAIGLRDIADSAVQGSVDDSSFTPTTSQFESDLDGKADSFYSKQALRFTSGVNAGITTKITAYEGATGKFTVSPLLPLAPSDNDEFTIYGFVQ